MEIQQLRHFIAAVKYGNIGKAAIELGISQSGISRSIRNLEGLLGVPLLIRGAHGVEPTGYGDALIPRAQMILNEEQHAIEELRRLGQEKEGLLRIGIMTNFVNNLVPEITFELLQVEPKLDVVITTDVLAPLVERLRTGQLDLLFGLIGFTVGLEEFVVRRLYTSRSDVVCPAGHPLATKQHITIEDLATAVWVMPNSAGFQEAFQAFFHTRGQYRPRQVVLTSSPGILRQALYALNSLTVMTREQSEADVRAGLMVRLPGEAPGGKIMAGILYRPNVVVTPAMRELITLAHRRTAAMRDAEQKVDIDEMA